MGTTPGTFAVPQLRAVREGKGLSRRALARLSLLRPMTIADLESGKSQARRSTIHALSKALGVKAADLMREV